MKKSNYYPNNRCNNGKFGHAFEGEVCSILQGNGYALIKKNKVFKNYNMRRDKATKREYDLEMYNPIENQVYIVECKSHLNPNRCVTLGQVKEFNHKLINYNGKHANWMMVSDTDFTIPARRYASKHNIELLNGKQLRQMKKRANSMKGVVVSVKSAIISTGLGGLETCINKVIKEYSKY